METDGPRVSLVKIAPLSTKTTTATSSGDEKRKPLVNLAFKLLNQSTGILAAQKTAPAAPFDETSFESPNEATTRYAN